MERHFSTAMGRFYELGHLTAAEVAQIFGRLITESLLENELTEHLAEAWGERAGHYGRLALAEQDSDASISTALNRWQGTNAAHWKAVSQ